jgi:NADH/F420H2 dehydrogenase subunit C
MEERRDEVDVVVSPVPTDDRVAMRELKNELEVLASVVGQKILPRLMKGNYFSIDVSPAQLMKICFELRDQLHFDLLTCVSGVDMLDYLEVVYHVRSLRRHALLQVVVKIDPKKPEIDSIISVWASANWLERETYDLFGIHFNGHPDLRRMLLDDDFDGYPLLKSFHQMPLTVKDRATTQTSPTMAVTDGCQQQGVEQVVPKRLGQGMQERLHPGTPTFGHVASNPEEQIEEHKS